MTTGSTACGAWMKIAKTTCALRVRHKGPHNAQRRWGEIIPEQEAPDSYVSLCGQWMARAQAWCAAKPGHYGACHTLESVLKARASQLDSATAKNKSRRRMLAAIKLTSGCVDCGFDLHSAALDFDHRLGESKRGDISKMLTFSLEAIFDEVAKTEVVCANCHRIRTAVRRSGDGIWE